MPLPVVAAKTPPAAATALLSSRLGLVKRPRLRRWLQRRRQRAWESSQRCRVRTSDSRLVTRRSCSAVDREPRSGRPCYHPRQHCRPSPQLVTLTANPRRAVVMIQARAPAGGRREAPARAPVEAVGAPRRTCRRRPGRRRWSPGGPTGAVQRARLGSQLEELRVQRLATRQRRHLAT